MSVYVITSNFSFCFILTLPLRLKVVQCLIILGDKCIIKLFDTVCFIASIIILCGIESCVKLLHKELCVYCLKPMYCRPLETCMLDTLGPE